MEYFIVAAAMVAAALWLYNDGKWRDARTAVESEFRGHLGSIVGH